tara:strand:+ start:423 stop:1631 length:1209 start_codon:yes stop_codon:yes gene_type:complete
MKSKLGKVGNFFQENNEMITIAIQVNDLLHNHEICYYNSELNQDDPDQGYQRKPGLPRISKIAKSIERTVNNDTFLPIPTAIVLSDRGVNYKFNNGQLDIIDGSFKLIDGQHRILAYKKAIEDLNCESLKAHYLPCTIIKIEQNKDLNNLEKKELELKHFNTINGEAKSVPVDLGNALLVNLYQAGALKSDEYDDSKIMSMELVMKLNDESGPWMNKVIMPNHQTYKRADWSSDPKLKHLRVVKSTSLVTSFKPLLNYLDNNVFTSMTTREVRLKTVYTILDNYWTVINKRMPNAIHEARDHVLQKSPGIFSMHYLLIELCKIIKSSGGENLTDINSFERRLSSQELDFMDESFWSNNRDNPGEATKFGNMKGFKVLSEAFLKNVVDSSENQEMIDAATEVF